MLNHCRATVAYVQTVFVWSRVSVRSQLWIMLDSLSLMHSMMIVHESDALCSSTSPAEQVGTGEWPGTALTPEHGVFTFTQKENS